MVCWLTVVPLRRHLVGSALSSGVQWRSRRPVAKPFGMYMCYRPVQLLLESWTAVSKTKKDGAREVLIRFRRSGHARAGSDQPTGRREAFVRDPDLTQAFSKDR